MRPILAAFVAALMLTGCSGGGPAKTRSSEAVTTSSPATIATSSSSGTAQPHTIPEAATVNTLAGATAFVRYFNDELGRALSIPDDSRILPLCLPQTAICESFQEDAVTLTKKKQRLSKQVLMIETLTPAGSGDGGSLRFEMHGTQPGGNVVDDTGAVISTNPEVKVDFVYYVLWTQTGWRVQDIKEGIS